MEMVDQKWASLGQVLMIMKVGTERAKSNLWVDFGQILLHFILVSLTYNHGNSFVNHSKGWPIKAIVRKAIAIIVFALP